MVNLGELGLGESQDREIEVPLVSPSEMVGLWMVQAEKRYLYVIHGQVLFLFHLVSLDHGFHLKYQILNLKFICG